MAAETSLWANRKCPAICAVVAIANMQYGLDSAVTAALQAMPGFLRVYGHADPTAEGGYAIGSVFQQLISSLLTLGAFLSSLFAGSFAHFFGRKPALWLACLLTAVGCRLRHLTGRRGILMIGAATQGACMLAMAVAASAASGTPAARSCLIAFVALHQLCYNAFIGDTSYPVATELVSTRLRSWTVGSAISLGYFLAWLTGFCSPYFINPDTLNWGAKYGYIWAGSNLCCFVFFFLCIPELKGRSLEEIDELFAKRVPAWKFKAHQTTRLDDALQEVQKQAQAETDKATTELVEIR